MISSAPGSGLSHPDSNYLPTIQKTSRNHDGDEGETTLGSGIIFLNIPNIPTTERLVFLHYIQQESRLNTFIYLLLAIEQLQCIYHQLRKKSIFIRMWKMLNLPTIDKLVWSENAYRNSLQYAITLWHKYMISFLNLCQKHMNNVSAIWIIFHLH